MALNFDLIAGPFGDCTSKYEVVVNIEMTFNELIDEILKHTNEWGKISIINDYSFKWDCLHCCEYEYGSLKQNREDIFTQEELNSTIEKIVSYGGWSNMDYKIKLK